MRIYLIRHGQSTGNAGTSTELDCGLSPLGQRQACAAAAVLARLGVTHVLSSPYRRTLETAEPIRQATGATAELWPAVHENHLKALPDGPWPLASRSQLLQAFPHFAAPADMKETHWAVRSEDPPGQWRRLGQAVTTLLERFRDEGDARPAVVTHQGAATYFLKQFLGLSDPKMFGAHIDNGSITILEHLKDGRPALRCLNWLPYSFEPHLQFERPASPLQRPGEPTSYGHAGPRGLGAAPRG